MEVDKNCMRLAHFYHSKITLNNIKEIEQDDAINYQIPVNSGFGQIKSDLEGYTALHVALATNNFTAFSRILKCDADFTMKNGRGETVIHAALNMPFQKFNSLLELKGGLFDRFITAVLDAHCTRKITKNPCNKNGISHFHVACMANNFRSIDFFIKNGVSLSEPINLDSAILPGYSPLHCAVRYNSLEAVKLLLIFGTNVYCKDAKGFTPFHTVIEQSIEIADWINMGKRSNCQKLKSELTRNSNILEEMLEKHKLNFVFIDKFKADKKCMIEDTGLSGLHVACTLENEFLATQLIEKKVDLEIAISNESQLCPGYTALHFAAHFNIKTLKLLIKHGANMFAEDAKGITPFQLCMQRHEAEVIEFLIASRQECNYIRFSDDAFLLVFIQAMKDKHLLKIFLQKIIKNVNVFIPIESPIWAGFTPLHLAVNFAGRYNESEEACQPAMHNKYNNCSKDEEQLYLERIKLLLEADAHVTNQDWHGSTALHHAFLLQREDVVNLLLQHHKLKISPTNDDNLSHIHIACAAGYYDLVLKLLEETSYVNLQTSFDYEYKRTYHKDTKAKTFFFTAGSTPLHIAVIVRDHQMVKMLMANGADLYAKDYEGMTPIHRLLVPDFHFQVVEMGNVLFSQETIRDCMTRFGLTHLHVASHVNNANAVERLLDLGADVEATIDYENDDPTDQSLSFLSSYSGYRPLDFAVKDSCIEVFDILLLRRWTNDPLNSISCKKFDVFLEKLFDCKMKTTLELVFGWRKLHEACFVMDIKKVEEVLKLGADPNLRIPEDYKTFPGFTPLHLLLRERNEHLIDKVTAIAQILVSHGADVTITNSDGFTPIHFIVPWCRSDTLLAIALLRGHKDFSVNPTDASGISHFHVACLCDEVEMVENFLKEGVNVNQMVKAFSKKHAGFTPLHFATLSKCKKTVDLLLEHGANVHAQDCHTGNTPLHYAVCWLDKSLDGENIVINLIRAGGKLHVQNVAGEIPFEKIVKTDNTARVVKIIKLLPQYRCFVNIFNTKNECGYIAAEIKDECKIDTIMSLPLYATVMKAPAINIYDEMGRTPIHNIVSIRKFKTPIKQFIKAVHGFVKLGIDIDHQTKNGDTALHYAVKFQNTKAVVALLALGADVNRTNNHRISPFSYSWNVTHQIERINYPTVIPYRIVMTLWKHVCKLQLTRFFVSEINRKTKIRAERKLISISETIKQCQVELERSKMTKIESSMVSFFSFLSDTGAVSAYPHMMLREREAVDHFFQNCNFRLRENLPELSGILQMQYKKALKRLTLVDSAKNGLDLLTEFVLPDLCGYHVLKFLTNDDLKKLVYVEEFLDVEFLMPPQKRQKLG